MIGFVKGCFVTVASLAARAFMLFLKFGIPVIIIVCVILGWGCCNMLKVIGGLIGTIFVIVLSVLSLAATIWIVVTVLRYMGVAI